MYEYQLFEHCLNIEQEAIDTVNDWYAGDSSIFKFYYQAYRVFVRIKFGNANLTKPTL